MDTSISDIARFAAGFMRGEGLKAKSRAEMLKGRLPIRSRSQFPVMAADAPPAERWKGLAAGLGVITFTGPQGRGFFKGGHNDSTANMMVCIEATRRCLLLLSNDVLAETSFPWLIRSILGDTGFPHRWEYPGSESVLPKRN